MFLLNKTAIISEIHILERTGVRKSIHSEFQYRDRVKVIYADSLPEQSLILGEVVITRVKQRNTYRIVPTLKS